MEFDTIVVRCKVGEDSSNFILKRCDVEFSAVIVL